MSTGSIEQNLTAQQWLNIAKQATTKREQRAALHNALKLSPHDKRLQTAFKALHQQRHYQTAADEGIFICYTGTDDLFAVELAETLREQGLPAWIDMLDIPLDAEADIEWEDEVRAALDESGLMLLILSPEAVESESIRAELEYFLQAGKVVLPLVYRDCDPRPLNLRQPMIDCRANTTTGLTTLYSLLRMTADS